MRKNKKWFLAILVSLFVSLGLIVAANYFIDPNNLYKTQTFKKVNDRKIETEEYLMKARELALKKPDVLFLGSSRTGLGLDPDYYLSLEGQEAYNAGLSSSSIYEQMRYLEYAILMNPSLQRVIIGIDFEGFNQYTKNNIVFNDQRLQSKHFIKKDLVTTLLTEEAFIDSIKVLYDNISGSHKFTGETFLDNGLKNEDRVLALNQELIKKGKNPYFEHLNDFLVKKGFLGDYQLSNQKINDFKKLVSLCSDNQIELIVFIHPSHAIQWEGIRKAGLWSQYEDWKREIVSITPIWDFSGYNSITTSPHDSFINYFDQSHYRKKVGNDVLNRILNIEEEQVSEDFGVWLTHSNIEEHIDKVRRDREEWVRDHSEVVRIIEGL